jgi:prepilin-type N-terminal cleavage/methylation domain-containing protein
MAKTIYKLDRNGQGGFTLVELLVVITILGVLAAVTIPQIVAFAGRGKADTANTEAHQVALAVVAAVTEQSTATNPWTTVDPTLTGQASGSNNEPYDFMANPGNLQATYTLDASGSITAASAAATSKWNGLSWGALGWYQP